MQPELSNANARKFVRQWVAKYGGFQGKQFTEEQTGGLEPFRWMLRKNLEETLAAHALTLVIPKDGERFNALMDTWGVLQPWAGTVETVQRIAKRYQVGMLWGGGRGKGSPGAPANNGFPLQRR